jgi:exopolyphosphatase/guanosine-5'-triphosphate,3'-diphosphate pyrophosphatase
MKAVIDLGSNTFNLLIGEIRDGKLNPAVNLEFPVKIGMGGMIDNTITDAAMQRAIVAITQFKSYIDRFEIKDIKTLATSAIRNANNGDVLVRSIKESLGIDIAVIDGDEEAQYVYFGACKSFKLPEDEVLVMDVGGGSAEFIIGRKDTIHWKKSFDLGAVRLLEKFTPSNPIELNEIQQLVDYIKLEIGPLIEVLKYYPLKTLVGTAGSFETLVDVVINDLHVIPISLSRDAFEINLKEFELFKEIIVTSTIDQRGKLKGMVDFRVEYISMATILISTIIELAGIKRLICSNYAMKEGAIYSMYKV